MHSDDGTNAVEVPQISILKRLRLLSITGNSITLLPAGLGVCTNLEVLRLDVDKMKSPPEDIVKEDVQIVLHYLRNFAAAQVREASSSRQLVMRISYFELFFKTASCAFRLLPHPDPLTLRFNTLQETGILDLTGSRHQEVTPAITDMTNLTFLSLQDNVVQSITPAICSLEKLTHLNLSGNLLKEIPPEIGNMTTLRFLSVQDNQLTALPREIRLLTNLTELHVHCKELWSPPQELHREGPELILKYLSRIEDGFSTGQLNLDACSLVEIPDECLFMTSLTLISICNNSIKSLPIGMVSLYADLALRFWFLVSLGVPDIHACVFRAIWGN